MLQKNFSWARRITCLANQVQSRKAITEFHQLQKSGQKITEFLLSSVVKVCGRVEALQEGKQAHCLILKLGFNADLILMTTLLDMYSKCTNIQEACRVFEEMPQRDVVVTNSMISGLCRCHLPSYAIDLFTKMNESERDVGTWNSLISGLGQNLEGRTALIIFGRMRVEDVELDVMTMMSILSICADMAMMVHAQQVHGLVIKSGFEQYLPVGNAIVDMYAKCGSMDDACLCFQNMPFKNVISWTSLISGYAKHGLGIEALKAFQQMEMEGVVPNKITFLGTLYACSHAGLLQEGWSNFTTMVHKYLITPTMEHYTCMVDLLARAGHLEEAHDFIERMPINPDAKLLTAFLSSCCHHKNVELARTVGQKLLQLQPQEAGAYISLSNFYGLVGDLEGVANVRRLMLERGIRKEKACTWIEISRKVHSFESGDRSHPDYLKICKYLEVLIQKMKNIGYVPDTSMVAQNVDELTKEEILLGHSEKLAIALGLMSTHPGTCILIVKNLRVCADCHVFTGLISKIEGREIVARDSSRFHHFKDGVCSCGNYWSFHFWFTFAEDLISMASSALAYPSDFQIPFDLFISKKHPGLPRGYLGLADSSGTIVYRVNRRSPKHNRVLLDAAGNPLISMRGSHDGSWQCFRGDGSGEDLIFRVERTLNTLTRTEFNIFLGGANCEDSTDFKMKGCPFQRSCTIYKGNSIVAQTSLMYKLGKAFVGRCKFRLTIFPGSGDHAVVMALIVIFFDGRRLSN